jgi:hypothetical protein
VLLRFEGAQAADGDLWIVFDGDGFGLLKREGCSGSRAGSVRRCDWRSGRRRRLCVDRGSR